MWMFGLFVRELLLGRSDPTPELPPLQAGQPSSLPAGALRTEIERCFSQQPDDRPTAREIFDRLA